MIYTLYKVIQNFITYLVESYWIFRVTDSFFWFYCLVGPMMIFYTKPSMSANKRMFIILSAIFISITLLLFWIMQAKAIGRYKCASHISNDMIAFLKCKAKLSTISSIIQDRNTQGAILEILLMTIINPSMGIPQLIWRIYHRPNIQGMGAAFKGKLFSNIIISMSLLWMFAKMIIYLIISCIIHLIQIIYDFI